MQLICLIIFLLVGLAFGVSDFESLLELKKGFKEDPLGVVLKSWNSKSLDSNGCPKNWRGIACIDGNVESITLDDVGIVGEFDFRAISGLKTLRNVSISNNRLSGSILEIGSLESLEVLDISSNFFDGFIPNNFTNLRKLVVVNLSLNNLSGIVPSGFNTLNKLNYLDLHSNGFSGNMMNLMSELGSVIKLDLSCNKFEGYLDLGLARSHFVSNIQHLNVSYNALAGELFAHDGLPYFDGLEVFDASYNRFNGSVPSFNFVVSLRVLRLQGNQFSGSIPVELLQESSMVLSELDLSLNELEGRVGSITSVTLKYLNLSSNKLSGSLPYRTGHCAIIDLSNNNLSGNFSRISNWGIDIEIINLSSNSLLGPVPNETSRFLRLTSFKASNNSLQGIISPLFGSNPELEIIDLSLNQLSGSLPPTLFNSTTLIDLNLSGNNFSGTIQIQLDWGVESFSSSQNLSLVSLNLSRNALSGRLPLEISNFRNLLYLDLSNNQFEGSIPTNLPDHLMGLNVSFNNLSGIIPKNLRRFPDTVFHPGNSLLVLSNSPMSSENISTEHHSHTKRAVKVALVAGFLGAAAILALILLVLFYKTRRKEDLDDGLEDMSNRKDSKSGGSSLPSTSPSHITVDPSSTAPSPNQGLSHSSGSITQKTKEIPSNASSSMVQNLFENITALRVSSPDKLAGDLHLFDGSVTFTAEELSHAPAKVIGRSCHGTLYRATLESGLVLVVKRLKEGIAKGRKEFAREAKKLGNVRHPNLVTLQGYYWGPKEHEKLLISYYVDAPCLAVYLQGAEHSDVLPLSLDKRLKVTREVAQCLDYLHNERAIPHGNLKSTNILLETSTTNVLLTDYSLHRIMTASGTSDQVLNSGALGYCPPEFTTSAKPCPSLKSDIYAFGVILLELITGRSSGDIVSANQGAVDLTDWVKMLERESRANECFDKAALGGDYVDSAPRILERLLRVALRCILPPSDRPDTRTVFQDLSAIVL